MQLKAFTVAVATCLATTTASWAAPIFDGTTLNRPVEAAKDSLAQSSFTDSSNPHDVQQEESNRLSNPIPKNLNEHQTQAASPVIFSSASAGEHVNVQDSNSNTFLAAKQDAERVQLSLASLLGIKLDPSHQGNPEQEKADLAEVARVLKASSLLPVRALIAVEANGNLVLMSENQRFIIKGTIYDVFNNMKELKTVQDINDYAFKTDYRRLGLDPESLNSARIGSGPINIVLYVDPASQITHDLMTAAMKLPDLENYSFYFVVMPTASEDSLRLSLKFYCAREDGNPEAGNLLYQGKLDSLTDTECESTVWDRTMNAAYFTGVDVVPFLVGADGSISRGLPPEGLANWATATVPVELVKLKDIELKKNIEENVTERALQQQAQQEIKDALENRENGNSTQPQSTSDTVAQPAANSALYVDDSEWRNFSNAKLKARAATLHERHLKELERYERSEERARTRYQATLERNQGSLEQARSYKLERRQRTIAHINEMNQNAYEKLQNQLKNIAEKRQQAVKEYRADLQDLRAQQQDLKGE